MTRYDEVLGREENIQEDVTPENERQGATQEIIAEKEGGTDE